jgi:hypothetical protein
VADEGNFGERMAVIRRARGITGGRRPIAEKFRTQIAATEQAFARDMPGEAKRYIAELAPQEPEACSVHHRRLACPVKACPVESERIPYNHRAAQYVFDRIMGKPTNRTEQSVTVTFVEHLTSVLLVAFGEVNAIADPDARRAAFAAKCRALLPGESGGPT